MFAVTGWNVDATQLKAQTQVFPSKGDDQNAKSSRKRKRAKDERPVGESGPNGTEITTNDNAPSEAMQSKKAKKHKSKPPASSDEATQSGTIKQNQQDTNHDLEQTSANDRKKQKKKLDYKAESQAQPSATGVTKTSIAPAASKLTPMQAAMRQKLVSARFRHLNETLYTAPSQQAQDLFDANPEMFEDYHAGFRQQVAVWPENPVDKMIQKIRQRGSVRLHSQKKAFKSKGKASEPALAAPLGGSALPRTQGTCIIADCGCGDARLASTLKSANDLQKLNVKVLSYDLHSPSSLITKADISALPLADGSADVAIFCLALMGTNWISFIEEAYRVLHWKGELWIAEIKSRFARAGKQGKVVEHSVGNRKKRAASIKAQESKRKEQQEAVEDEVLQTEVDGVEKMQQETDVQGFVDVLRRRGFVLKDDTSGIDLSNKMFVSMEFIKAAAPTKGKGFVEQPLNNKKPRAAPTTQEDVATEDEGKTLKPCLYKIR